MTERLRNKCDLFLRNRNAVSKKFMLEKGMMSIAAGLIFTGADKEADIEKLTECRKLLNKHTGFFSEYRDAVKLALLSEMALSEAPEQYIEDVKAVYKKLHKGKFRDNSYMVLAAMLICDLGKQESADEIVEKHNEIMKQMEKQHPILTGSEDISYVILLALSDRPVDTMISDMNECFDYLRKTCKIKADPDSVQGLSEILALTDGNIREKCDKVISIYNILKDNKADITGGCAFSALGTLIGIDEAPEAIAAEILEADTFLDGCKGFDEKSVNKNQRLMFAVMLSAESFEMASSVISNTFINNALGIIKAQKIATMITIISNVLPTVLGAVIDNVSEKNDNSDTKESEQKASES
ncbi:DUF4003 family protein [Ruminococcus flavefaciens]|jgi:hypothetical protein|uniref:DUF4003 family protein n=1 Tax=Ruminococcus flavefaciens TaxID=1265 RepID=UPI0026ED76D9|nr:DUF4003 family protein [Ruminococcus flavefaciens]